MSCLLIIRAWIGVYLEKVDSGRIDPAEIDWLLCHYSARSLRDGRVDRDFVLHRLQRMQHLR